MVAGLSRDKEKQAAEEYMTNTIQKAYNWATKSRVTVPLSAMNMVI